MGVRMQMQMGKRMRDWPWRQGTQGIEVQRWRGTVWREVGCLEVGDALRRVKSNL